MKDKKQSVSQQRRRFLLNAGLGGGAAVAAAMVPASVAAASEAQPAKARDGYHLSQHILDYYKSAAS